jgi:hypothetical protein
MFPRGHGILRNEFRTRPARDNDAAGFFAYCVIFTDYTARIGTYQQV